MSFTSWREALDAAKLRLGDGAQAVDDEADAVAIGARPNDHLAALECAGVPRRILRELFRGAQPFASGTPEYNVELARRIYRGESLYLYGERGVGKSHVAAAGLLGLRHLHRLAFADLLWAEWPVALDRLREEQRAEHDGPSSRERYVNEMRAAKVLVLDEIKPTCRPTPFAVDTLDVILRERYNDCLQTVVTSNLSPDQLDSALQRAGYDAVIVEPLVSRIIGSAQSGGGIVEMKGPDRRTPATTRTGWQEE